MGMRWAASTDMGNQLSHIWIDQFTYWDSWQVHEDFHETFEDVVVDTCARCGEVLLDGPEEPVFRVVHSDLFDQYSIDSHVQGRLGLGIE